MVNCLLFERDGAAPPCRKDPVAGRNDDFDAGMKDMTLANLKPGQRAVVAGFAEMGPVMQRLMQLGLLEDSDIEVVRRAPAGDPIEIRILGYSLSLRKSEAKLIRVKNVT